MKDKIKIDVYQQDWMPGFGMFSTVETGDGILEPCLPLNKNAKPVFCINVGGMLTAKMKEDLSHDEFIEHVVETYFHEFLHAIEQHVRADFSEERVDYLTEKYMKKYRGAEEDNTQETADDSCVHYKNTEGAK